MRLSTSSSWQASLHPWPLSQPWSPHMLSALAACGRPARISRSASSKPLNRAVLLYERVCEELHEQRECRALRDGFLTRQFKQHARFFSAPILKRDVSRPSSNSLPPPFGSATAHRG